MLSDIMLSDTMLSDTMLSAIMLNVGYLYRRSAELPILLVIRFLMIC